MQPSNLPTEKLIDSLYVQAMEYARLYKLPKEFVWYALGFAYHVPVISNSMFDSLLDYARKEYSDLKERFAPIPET